MSAIKKARGRKARCPYCGGAHTHRKGVRLTATLGDQPLRYCTDCERKFTLHPQTGRRTTRVVNPVSKPL